MSLSLHTIKPAKGSRKSKKRIGRGLAKKGTTSGRGQKGQKARAGSGGLQLKGIRSLMLSQPKLRGFKSGKPKPSVVNVKTLDKNFIDGEVVTPKVLLNKGLVSETKNGVKILGDGTISKKLNIKGCKLAESAKTKILESGGAVS